jgi:hypothetical protein
MSLPLAVASFLRRLVSVGAFTLTAMAKGELSARCPLIT